MNSSNPQIFGTCNWPLTAHKLTTCQVRATRVKASVVETEASNHPQNPLRSLVSSIFQPANPWSQSSPCVFQQICIVSSRVFLRHKWRTATWNTKWPRLELFRAKWPRHFFVPKTHQGQEPPWQAVGGQKYLGIGFIHVWFGCCKRMPKELPLPLQMRGQVHKKRRQTAAEKLAADTITGGQPLDVPVWKVEGVISGGEALVLLILSFKLIVCTYCIYHYLSILT